MMIKHDDMIDCNINIINKYMDMVLHDIKYLSNYINYIERRIAQVPEDRIT